MLQMSGKAPFVVSLSNHGVSNNPSANQIKEEGRLMDFDGRVALVTGSGRNQGRATILEFAKHGANVVVNARTNQKEADAVAEEARGLGAKAISVVADVSDQKQVQAMFDKAFSEFGRVDILVNNASYRPRKAFVELTYEDWRYVLGITLDGAFFCCKAVVPGMIERGWGSITNISGLMAFAGRGLGAHASVAKHALHGLTRSLSSELAPQGIRVNTVVPRRHRHHQRRPSDAGEPAASRRHHCPAPPGSTRGGGQGHRVPGL